MTTFRASEQSRRKPACPRCRKRRHHTKECPMTTLSHPDTNSTEENTMDHCDFCETTVDSASTGSTGVSICLDCRSEANVEVIA